MKLIKSYISNTIIAISIIILFLSSLYLNNLLVLCIMFIVIMSLILIIKRLESKPLINTINETFTSNKYSEGIKYLESKKGTFWISGNNTLCLIYLPLFYMFNDETYKAKVIITNNPRIRKYKLLYYPMFLIAVAEGDKEKIDSLSKKILNIKSPRYNEQKENVKKILEMIESNTVNVEVYKNTKYPILKKVCERINGDDNVESLELSKDDIIIYRKTTGITKLIKIILNILSCLSLHMSLGVLSIIVQHSPSTNPEAMLYFELRFFWIMYLFLPITLGNVIYGLYLKNKHYKYKSSVIIGIIFSILLILYGSMYFFISRPY